MKSFVEKNVPFNLSMPCPHNAILVGANLLSVPCAEPDFTAYGLLDALGGPAVVTSVQTFDADSGQFQTAGYKNGNPAGVGSVRPTCRRVG